MSVIGSSAAGGPGPGESERVRLAGLASAAVARVPGVRELDAGDDGQFATFDRAGVPILGVRCVAATSGYDIAIQIVCDLVDLQQLGDQIAAAVTRAAENAQITVDRVSVHVSDVMAGEGT